MKQPHIQKRRASSGTPFRTDAAVETVIRKEEEHRAQYLAKKLGIPYLNLLTFPVESDGLRVLEEDKARLAKIAPVQKRGKELLMAVFDPTQPETQGVLDGLKELGYLITTVVVSETSLERAWGYYKDIQRALRSKKHIAGKVEVDPARITDYQTRIATLEHIAKLFRETPANETTELVEILIAGALKTFASDIHLEAKEETVRVRYRIDGILQDALRFPEKTYPLILSRIKLLAGLKINVHNVAQDGRFSIAVAKDAQIEVRVAILPGPDGENVVMRVLNPRTISLSLEDLGMRPEVYQVVAKELERANGMILTTGPTGSGKTTTLYAFVKKVNTTDVKIITIEDPIEYHLEGIEQTQVDPDKSYTFATGLKAIVRQDPDIILIGEIRDYETADIAMHSALTGHLVFATLHTNDAAGAIPRLINMGVNAVVAAPALNVIIAQRLVRRLCKACLASAALGKEGAEKIKNELASLPAAIPYKSPREGLQLPKPVGCTTCNNTGYKGRIGIFETFVVDDDMEKFILQGPSITEMTERAIAKGMVTMKQDGFLKVLEGMTTIEEVQRVIG